MTRKKIKFEGTLYVTREVKLPLTIALQLTEIARQWLVFLYM